MDSLHAILLEALGAALRSETAACSETLSARAWAELFALADAHRVLPMVYQAMYRSEAARRTDPALFAPYKSRVMRDVIVQTQRTQAFFELYDALCAEGLTPIVVKGVVCRSLYPSPDHRMSADEDILLPQDQLRACHRALVAAGLLTEGDEEKTEREYETSFFSRDRVTHIEVHSSLFPPESDAYGDMAGLFEGAIARSGEREVSGHRLRTLSHTDHMLFLLCHAFKHFLHSGFGLRQVCDIALYANVYGGEIDWASVQSACRSIRAERFAAAVFTIAERYFTFDPVRACFPGSWRALEVDPDPLLEDLLGSGVYGGASLSRRHSSRITLSAVSASRRGATERAGVLKALFPPVDALQGRYPYLQTKKWLLPVAWAQRIARYRRETARTRDNSAAEAVRIGRERTELLREYDII